MSRRRKFNGPAAASWLAPLCCCLAGCGLFQGGTTDEQQVNDALLAVLSSGGEQICVDRETYGQPLAVFRAMLPAPDPARRPLRWGAPAPLEPGRNLTAGDLVDTEFKGEQALLPERPSVDPGLPIFEQLQLNAWAKEASFMPADSGVNVANSPGAPRARVRWWLLNRFDSSCTPTYTVSKPAILRTVAFVSVTAAHQGSTYAFRKDGAKWSAYAKWSTWLY